MSLPTWAKIGLAGAVGGGIIGASIAPDDRADQTGGSTMKVAGALGLAGGIAGASLLPVSEKIADTGINMAGKAANKVAELKKPGAMKKLLDKGADAALNGAGKIAGAGIGIAAIPAGITKSVADNLLEEVGEDAGSLFNIKFNGKGKLLMAGIAMMSAVNEGYNAYTESRKGTSSGRVLSPTPSFMEEQRQVQENRSIRMAEEYGAGGDLVFALNRNR